MRLSDPNIFYDRKGGCALRISENVSWVSDMCCKEIEIESPIIVESDTSICCKFIGAYTYIADNVTIQKTAQIGRFCTVGANTIIGEMFPNMSNISTSDFFRDKGKWSFYYSDYNYSKVECSEKLCQIGNDVWIGPNSRILEGVTISDGAVIYPGALVYRDVEPYEIFGRNVSEQEFRFDKETVELLLDLKWWYYTPGQMNNLDIFETKNLNHINNKNRVGLCPKIFYVRPDATQIFRNDDGEVVKIFDGNEHSVKKGGISCDSPIYYEEEKKLEVKGWFLPSYVYDKIEVFCNDRKLGDASLHILRLDVRNNYMNYCDPRAGFEYTCNCDISEDENVITLVCINMNQEVHRTSKKIQRMGWKYLLSSLNTEDIAPVFCDRDGVNIIAETREDIRSIISGKFAEIGKQVSFDGVFNQNLILHSSNQWREEENNISLLELSCFRNGLLDYKRLKTISMRNKIKKEKLVAQIKKYFGRELLAVYGNCQIMSINSILRSSKKLMDRYIILSFPPVQSFDNEEKLYGVDAKIMEQIDVFMYQLVSRTNKFSEKLATDCLTKNLNHNVKTCIIPNVYFTGYFPQYVANRFNPIDYYVNGPFPYGDKNIEEMWADKSAEEISELLKNDDFYSKDEVLDNVEASFGELEKREKDCNVIISDYLRKNYKYKRCFYSTNHVSNFVLLELLQRALKYLEIDADDFKLSKTWENDGREIPIYPSVQKILQLDFYKERYCYFKLVKEEPSSLEEYVDDYIKYCKPVWEAKNSKEIF